MQELPKGKDFESNFCRFGGANPDLPPDPEQVNPVVRIVGRWSTGFSLHGQMRQAQSCALADLEIWVGWPGLD
ncbi:MAG: hypothetical protein H7Z17_01420 [Fuerstia sp.]|nr:hypothetical protein [Fuerstiella sp.]